MDTLALPMNGPASDSLFAPGRRAACIGAVALISMLAFEAIAVAAAMPAIATALDGLNQYALAFGGTLATSVLGMVYAGASCDRVGPLRSTWVGLLVFALGLLMAGAAQDMGCLLAGRIVQGLGAGTLGVALYAGMGPVVPEPLHPRLFALFAGAWVLPGLLGPALAAWLTAQFGWRAVFLSVAVAVPVAAALLLPSLARLPAPPPNQEPPVWRQTRSAWAALAALGMLGLHAASQPGAWTLPALLMGLLASGIAAQRLLPPGSLRVAPGLPSVVMLRALFSAAFYSAETFIPLYLNREQGWSLTAAGLALSLAAVLWSAGSALQTRIHGEAWRRRGLRAGFVLQALGIAFVLAVPAAWLSPAWLVAGWAVAGLGIGLGFPMLSVRLLALSNAENRGRNSAALQLADALGTSAALALAGALFNAAGAQRLSYLLVIGLALGLSLLGALLSRRAFQDS